MEVTPFQQARILAEALPYMQRYDEAIVVVKYGGHAMGEESLAREFARDIVLLEQTAINPVVVHGGGPQIEAMLKKVGVQSQYAGGLRITDEKTLEIVEMVLAGSINKQMVGYINEAGGKAVGLCGKDGNMVVARKLTRTIVDPDSHIEKVVDLGFVGEPDKVDTTVLTQILGRELIPVLAPVAAAPNGGTFNVNADTFAGAIAGALKAKRLLLLTDVPGVLDKSKHLIKELSVDDARRLIADGTISGGMIPKVETCIDALDARRRRRGHPRRQGAARGAARIVHRAWRRHADPQLTPMQSVNARERLHALGPGIIAATSFGVGDAFAKVALAAGSDVLIAGAVPRSRRHRHSVLLPAHRCTAAAGDAARAPHRTWARRAVRRDRLRPVQGDPAHHRADRGAHLFHLSAVDRNRRRDLRRGAAELAGVARGPCCLLRPGADDRGLSARAVDRRIGVRGRSCALPHGVFAGRAHRVAKARSSV